MPSFSDHNDQFLLDGQPFRILSGAIHYFRVPEAYWRDRLYLLRAMGLNTLETYVAWNVHEPHPGEFRFDGMLDIVKYIQYAAELGLYVIVRPGPYICAEWDMGGLPAWLLRDPHMRLRCMYEPYLHAVDRFYNELMPRLAPLQITQGGPIIAMQIENEYGSYGNDRRYLEYLEHGLRARGIDVLLFTSDGPDDTMLQYGTLPGILKTVNFGSRPVEAFAKLREVQPDRPAMCMEFWNGWFDHWGESHHARPAADAAAALDTILASGASVNFYLFHGGTNFGYMNGANSDAGTYQPTITSYDYDAPLSEAGDITPKYTTFREMLGCYAPQTALPLPDPRPKMALGPVEMTESVTLFEALDTLSTPVRRPAPVPMEYIGQNHGFILYRTFITGSRESTLALKDVHDRAQVFVDGKPLATLDRQSGPSGVMLSTTSRETRLDILVENMGRVNYGPEMGDRKGITGAVLFGQQTLFDWLIFPLPLDDLAALTFHDCVPVDEPAFYGARFTIPVPQDTFLALPGWTKGVVWINGINLGRYWNRGPQHTLYVPASFLKAGDNELIILELHGLERPLIEFTNRPIWDSSELSKEMME